MGHQDRTFKRSEEKNKELKEKRNITFQQIVQAINDGNLIEIIPHHNPEKYPNQKILAIFIHDYIYSVPCLIQNNSCLLKTIFKSRKLKNFYLPNINND